ncbi:MAG: Type 1 glutamine amidotransferase-like domain-containing protein, partial [Microcystis panniformis]
MPNNHDRDFHYSCRCGKANFQSVKHRSGILLIGGAEGGKLGEDQATTWLLNRAKGGNYLVLRFGDLGDQADWICDNYPSLIGSAAELSIDSREGANHPDVIEYIRNADILFFAGGDQNQYEDLWESTKVETAINYLINDKKVPVAGTSAGMAILGDFYYA